MFNFNFVSLRISSICLLVCCVGCWQRAQKEVVVYAALDREFSEAILDEFTQTTGIKVLANYDVESNKTVGLTNRIIAEGQRPRCDLFWNNEILHTFRLEHQGLLQTYTSARAADYPSAYQSASGSWHGFAARARVLLVNTDRVAEEETPTSIHDLLDPRWKGQVGIAKPLFGTTATHAACLFSVWGDQQARDFFRQLKANAQLHSGNKQVALAVSSGALAFGLTDTDDAIIELEESDGPLKIVYPDQGEDQLGTLFVPNTLCIIRGGPHAEHARTLVDYLLSPEVEKKLAEGRSAQIPLNRHTTARLRVETPDTVKAMEVDFEAAAREWDSAAEFLRELFMAAD